MGTSWIKLLNRYKKYRDKSVTTDDNKYSYQPHPCTTTTLYCHSITLLVMITSDIASNCNMIWRDNAELQWCMGVANNYTYILVPVLFTPVQQFHPNCSHTFYTCSTLYLFKFLGKFLCLVNKILVIDSWMQFYIEITIVQGSTSPKHSIFAQSDTCMRCMVIIDGLGLGRSLSTTTLPMINQLLNLQLTTKTDELN